MDDTDEDPEPPEHDVPGLTDERWLMLHREAGDVDFVGDGASSFTLQDGEGMLVRLPYNQPFAGSVLFGPFEEARIRVRGEYNRSRTSALILEFDNVSARLRVSGNEPALLDGTQLTRDAALPARGILELAHGVRLRIEHGLAPVLARRARVDGYVLLGRKEKCGLLSPDHQLAVGVSQHGWAFFDVIDGAPDVPHVIARIADPQLTIVPRGGHLRVPWSVLRQPSIVVAVARKLWRLAFTRSVADLSLDDEGNLWAHRFAEPRLPVEGDPAVRVVMEHLLWLWPSSTLPDTTSGELDVAKIAPLIRDDAVNVLLAQRRGADEGRAAFLAWLDALEEEHGAAPYEAIFNACRDEWKTAIRKERALLTWLNSAAPRELHRSDGFDLAESEANLSAPRRVTVEPRFARLVQITAVPTSGFPTAQQAWASVRWDRGPGIVQEEEHLFLADGRRVSIQLPSAPGRGGHPLRFSAEHGSVVATGKTGVLQCNGKRMSRAVNCDAGDVVEVGELKFQIDFVRMEDRPSVARAMSSQFEEEARERQVWAGSTHRHPVTLSPNLAVGVFDMLYQHVTSAHSAPLLIPQTTRSVRITVPRDDTQSFVLPGVTRSAEQTRRPSEWMEPHLGPLVVEFPTLEAVRALSLKNLRAASEIHLPKLRRTKVLLVHRLPFLQRLVVPELTDVDLISIIDCSRLEHVSLGRGQPLILLRELPKLRSLDLPPATDGVVVSAGGQNHAAVEQAANEHNRSGVRFGNVSVSYETRNIQGDDMSHTREASFAYAAHDDAGVLAAALARKLQPMSASHSVCFITSAETPELTHLARHVPVPPGLSPLAPSASAGWVSNVHIDQWLNWAGAFEPAPSVGR